jgi:ribosomal protein L16 Arg81 hydroxylase
MAWMHRLSNERKPMLATLADLLAPVSTSEFLEVFRARKRLHIAASDPTRAETLFSWRDIDTLLSEHALDEKVRIMRDGVQVPRQLYRSNEGKQLNVRAFHDLLPQGVSIVVDSVHRSIPQIGQLSAAIEREMGINTNVNAYLSFFKGGAFKPHWDVMDVLVVQVHGNKQWRVWNTEVPHPVEIADQLKIDASVAPDQEVKMTPGDVLFIPRGEPHSAAVSTGRSVHLTIGLLSHTGINFLDYLRKEAANDPVLRMDLPRHSSDEQSGAHEAALKRRLHHLIDAASMSQFLQEGDLSRLPMVQTAVAGELPQMEDVLRLTLRRRVPLPNVPPGGEAQPVMIGGEARRLSPALIDALRWFFDHDPTSLRALHSGLTPLHGQGSTEAAIRDLLRLGFITVNRNRQ